VADSWDVDVLAMPGAADPLPTNKIEKYAVRIRWPCERCSDEETFVLLIAPDVTASGEMLRRRSMIGTASSRTSMKMFASADVVKKRIGERKGARKSCASVSAMELVRCGEGDSPSQ